MYLVIQDEEIDLFPALFNSVGEAQRHIADSSGVCRLFEVIEGKPHMTKEVCFIIVKKAIIEEE